MLVGSESGDLVCVIRRTLQTFEIFAETLHLGGWPSSIDEAAYHSGFLILAEARRSQTPRTTLKYFDLIWNGDESSLTAFSGPDIIEGEKYLSAAVGHDYFAIATRFERRCRVKLFHRSKRDPYRTIEAPGLIRKILIRGHWLIIIHRDQWSKLSVHNLSSQNNNEWPHPCVRHILDIPHCGENISIDPQLQTAIVEIEQNFFSTYTANVGSVLSLEKVKSKRQSTVAFDENARYYMFGTGNLYNLKGSRIKGLPRLLGKVPKSFGRYIGAIFDDQTILYLFDYGIFRHLMCDPPNHSNDSEEHNSSVICELNLMTSSSRSYAF